MNYLYKYPILLKNTHFTGYDFVSKNEQELHDYYSILDNIISVTDEGNIYMLDIGEEILLKNFDILKLFTKTSILKLSKNIEFSNMELKKIKELKENSYKLAFYFDNNKKYDNEEFLKYVEYVIVDAFSFQFYQKEIYDLDKKIILTEVDTTDIYEKNKDFEIDLFVGNFEHVKQEVVESYNRDNDKVVILNLLNELETKHDVNTLANIFAKNTDLTIKLLQYLNSPAIGLKVDVNSIHQAITLLGKIPLMTWLGMFLYGSDTTKFSSLLKIKVKNRITSISLFLESIGDIRSIQKGLLVASLSLADNIVNKSLDELINGLSMNDDLKDAILKKNGRLGDALVLTIALENKEQDEIDRIFKEYAIKESYKNQFYKIYNLLVKPEEEEEKNILIKLTKKLFRSFSL